MRCSLRCLPWFPSLPPFLTPFSSALLCQVIAILDVDMVQQLLWSSEHRKKKVTSPPYIGRPHPHLV